tara:strand:+ start:80 stop:664 length:585 start_codon:yes stop_codon:yes gene_type:complete
MAINAEHYLSQLKALLPRGFLWVDLAQNKLGQLLHAIADELARIDARGNDLIDEADPRTTYELLIEWEKAFGLPDPCLTEALTLEQRNKVLHAKVTNLGGQSRQFFIDLAKGLGYTVTITEFDPFTVASTVDESIYGEDWQFAWQVNSPSETVNFLTVASDVDTPLANWGNQRLECAITRLKPAHTIVQFSYGG